MKDIEMYAPWLREALTYIPQTAGEITIYIALIIAACALGVLVLLWCRKLERRK